MPRSTTVSLPAGSWTEITDADVTAITFMNEGPGYVRVMATVGATPPTTLAGSFKYEPRRGEANITLSDLFPGVSGANRVYAISEQKGAVAVSHA